MTLYTPHSDPAERARRQRRGAQWLSPGRVGALVRRYLYLLRSSWTRVFELAYWPMVQLILWGFISQHLASSSTWVAQAAGVLIGAVLLWDILFRGAIGYAISFMEEMYARNLGHLFITPLRPHELVLALISISALRTLVGVLPAMLLAIPLYHFSIFSMGLPLLAFFANLMVTAWVVGILVTALLLRVGLGAESVAWMVVFMMAPLSAVYYPVTTLPDWLQPVALALPTTHVFEGMRAVLFDGVFRADLMLNAAALNLLYIAVASGIFLLAFRSARIRGSLLQSGE